MSVVDASNHMRGQYALIVLGKIVGCDVWVASNDRNRTHQGKKLGEGCLTKLPGSGLSLEAIRAVALPDELESAMA